MRAIELDVWADPQGGKFLNPGLPIALGVQVPDDPAMHEPGFKVMHQADVDTRANCVSLKICLTQVRDWSEQHPGHVPMMVQLEVKDAAADTRRARRARRRDPLGDAAERDRHPG